MPFKDGAKVLSCSDYLDRVLQLFSYYKYFSSINTVYIQHASGNIFYELYTVTEMSKQ